MKLVEGDLTKIPLGPNDYLCHQCNCKTTDGLGLSKAIFDRYKEANIYSDGSERRPGEVIVRKPVINLLGQFYPGPPRYSNDSRTKREGWFREALDKISSLDLEIEKLYLPYKIGCGLAKGSWTTYSAILEAWAASQSFDVIIVRYG